jgi:tetratricopeptide (TPR) repeat protein/TolB-like protein/predicted Ser/Thr protein kinase
MLGETVGHYRILERLGTGGMGEVYLAEDLKLKRKAAVKFIALELTRDKARRDRFVQEATLAAAIDHPHLASIYDIDQAGDRTFIAMEYVRGQTLREMLAHGPLPLRRALDLTIQIGEALAKVHQHGVIHRDLKPENVIVSGDGYAKVIDFGLAKLTEPLAPDPAARTATNLQVQTADGLVMGTVAYMSPEQARGDQVDARSDIFSFGVLLHELLTGVAPFRRRSAAETLSAILTVTPPDVVVPDHATALELQRIVRKCLVKDAESRYQSLRDVVVDLRGVRDQLTSGTQTATVRPAPASGRSRLWIAAAIGAIVILGVAGWFWSRNHGSGSAGAAAGRPAIAVMAFENVGGATDTAWLSAGLPSMLVTGLAQSPEIEVITGDRLNEAARQAGRETFASIDPAARLDVVRRAGATIVVNGTIIRAGDGLRIDARVEDLAAGRVVLADNVRGTDPLALADELAVRIRRGLNVRTAANVRPVAELSSTSVEAYRVFAAGVEAAANVRTAEAYKLFNEAISLDPDFALAHLWIYRLAGPFEVRNKHLALAAQHLDRLTERDALSVEAALAESQRRPEDALAKYEQLLARYPDAADGYVGAAQINRYWLGNPPRGVEIMERAVAAIPTVGFLYNLLGYSYLGDGRPADAIRAFETYVKLRPHEPNSLDSLAEGHLAAGDLTRAEETVNRAIAAGHPGSRVTLAWIRAVQGRYDEALPTLPNSGAAGIYARGRVGQYRDAEAGLSQGLARLGMPAAESAAIVEALRAVLALDRNDCPTVIARFESVRNSAGFFSGGPTAMADLLIGTCEARMGRVPAARARLERHRAEWSSPAQDIRWWVRQLDGEIALAAGEPAAAAAAFEAAEPNRKMPFNRSGLAAVITLLSNSLVLRDGLARARAAQGRHEDAIGIYRRLLTTNRESKFTSFYEPRYVLAIARLLDKTGNRNEARAEYKRFLDLWKQADPELPELAEARAKVR